MLNEPNKAVLFHYICQLLPHEAQAEFDRIAAASLDGGKNCSFTQIKLLALRKDCPSQLFSGLGSLGMMLSAWEHCYSLYTD